MRRRTSNALTALGAATIILLLGAGAPHSQTMKLNDDDEGAWSTSLDGPLFDNDIRWVPGDTRTAEFQVKNGTDADGSLSVHVDGSNVVASEVFTVGLGGVMGQCAEVPVPGRSERTVVATVHMSADATNATQKDRSELDVVLQWGDHGAASPCVPSFDEAKGGER